ncbi:MAG: metal-dependent transcriptional regulator [Lachnospiraceae bacterium]|nr:metal-dependent transcriptional regulator [Lachnospiraceae bacterium]
MKNHESSEDYLERILMLQEKKGQVRSIDIVNDMNFSKPSISIAMKKLREGGMILMDSGGYITLTPTGRAIAEKIYSRHRLLEKVLVAIGVDPVKAEEEACHIEHDIDDDTYEKINAFYHKMLENKDPKE